MHRSLVKISRSVSGLLGRTISPSWGTSRSIVTGAGSSKCLELHDKSDYGDDLAILEAKSKKDLFHQKKYYEKLLWELKLKQRLQAKNALKKKVAYEQSLSKLKLKVNELEADNDKQREDLEFLQYLEGKGTHNLLQRKAEYEELLTKSQLLSELKLNANHIYEQFLSELTLNVTDMRERLLSQLQLLSELKLKVDDSYLEAMAAYEQLSSYLKGLAMANGWWVVTGLSMCIWWTSR